MLLIVGPKDLTTAPGTETWHLAAWRFRVGTFERIASGDRAMRHIAISPSLVD